MIDPDPVTDPAQCMDSAWQAYELAKAAFLAEHPDMTPEELEQALRRAAEEHGL